MPVDFYERIARGFYTNKEPYPEKPNIPDVLKKAAIHLTDVEIASLPGVIAEHRHATERYGECVRAWNARETDLETQFVADLHAHYGMTGHPKADALYRRAHELGCSYGHSEIVSHYEDLLELVR